MNRHLLIIDDDALGAELLARALRLEGFTAECVRSFDEGLEYLKHNGVAVVLCDLCLKESGPEETISRLHELDVTRLIAITASPSTDLLNHVAVTGAGYCLKPIHVPSLVDKILMRIERQHGSRDVENEIVERNQRLTGASAMLPPISNQTKVSLSLGQMCVFIAAIVGATFAVTTKIGSVETSVEKLAVRVTALEAAVKADTDAGKLRDGGERAINTWRYGVTTDLHRLGEMTGTPITTKDPPSQ